jgi:hypothetical protein
MSDITDRLCRASTDDPRTPLWIRPLIDEATVEIKFYALRRISNPKTLIIDKPSDS